MRHPGNSAMPASDTPRLDAEVLLAHVLGVGRTGVLAHPDAPVGDGSASTFRTLIARRLAGEPVAYIRGIREFHGLAFSVDPRVLIPRPETEQLVDLGFERVRAILTGAPRPPGTPDIRAWDVATGSGAIAVALAALLRRRGYLDEVRLIASDISPEALAVAIENAVAHGVADRVELVRGDLLDIPDRAPVDVLLANLPYIPSGDLAGLPAEVRAEPRLALDGGPDGMDLVRRLLAGLPEVLLPGGRAMLEIGADQADLMAAAVAGALPDAWTAVIHRDLADRPRIAEVDPRRTDGCTMTAVVIDAGDPAALDAAAAAIIGGAIVGLPTETVYGLAVLPQTAPLAALVAAKDRPLDKGIAVLIDGLDQVADLVELPEAARRLAAACWPGALTLVLPLRSGVVMPDVVTGGRSTLGVRLPDHPVPRALARRLGPLAVSSANRSGEPDARTAAELLAAVGPALAVVIDDGPVRGGVPSTVVAVAADGGLTILRAGALDLATLQAAASRGRHERQASPLRAMTWPRVHCPCSRACRAAPGGPT